MVEVDLSGHPVGTFHLQPRQPALLLPDAVGGTFHKSHLAVSAELLHPGNGARRGLEVRGAMNKHQATSLIVQI